MPSGRVGVPEGLLFCIGSLVWLQEHMWCKSLGISDTDLGLDIWSFPYTGAAIKQII